MESVAWVERYFWFGAMYEMVCLSIIFGIEPNLMKQQGVNDLNTLFDMDQEHRRSGALSELGVQYAGSNGTIPTRDRWGDDNAASRTRGYEGGLLAFALFVFLALL